MSSEAFLSYDHEFSLQELLRGVSLERLDSVLQVLLQTPVRIVDLRGQCLSGDELSNANQAPIIYELEPVGYLQASASVTQLQAAAQCIQLLLHSNARYLMASDIHRQTQRDDFEELQRRHTALERSEAKYKALSASLDKRVQEQVKTIESAKIKLYESEKLAAVGRLAAGVAHEINNPIGFIRSNLSSAQNYLEPLREIHQLIEQRASIDALRHFWAKGQLGFMHEDLTDILQESIEGVDRIAAIVSDLKSFSRVNDAQEESANINEIIRQMCHVSAPQIQQRIEILQELGHIPQTYCHPAQIGQALLGVFLNAIDAIPAQGKIRFKTGLKEDRIVIDIQDTGVGINADDLTHVLEPFFTTKPVGQGVGLGLTVCANVIHAHGGSLDIKSKPGVGTRVSIVLPVRHQ